MAQFLQKILGGNQPVPSQVPAAEDDFADFAGAPDPSPISIIGDSSAAALSEAAVPTASNVPLRPYTKWYRVWERTSIRDFYAELFIMPFIVVVILVHIWGTRKNKRKAKSWLAAHVPVLQQEYASVGFSGRKVAMLDEPDGAQIKSSLLSNDTKFPPTFVKERSATEFLTYATGRQNVAFTDIRILLAKRYNPVGQLGENILGFLFESFAPPFEKMEATTYLFDGREADLVANLNPDVKKEKFNSTYDGFVWAVVHKDVMKNIRDNRYDISLASQKDHPKLPNWVTVMSESAEITDSLLSNDLVKAIEGAGDLFETLIVTDQPVDAPKKLNDCIPKKRVSVSIRLPSASSPSAYAPSIPMFHAFLRLPDTLVSSAHFRPEAMKHVRATREAEMRKIKKTDEDERAEKRKGETDKKKAEERDKQLRSMSAEEQKKFLERERAADMRKSQKKRSVKG